MGIREGSASPNLAMCLLERPCPFRTMALRLFPLSFLLLAAGCGGFVSTNPSSHSSALPLIAALTAKPASNGRRNRRIHGNGYKFDATELPMAEERDGYPRGNVVHLHHAGNQYFRQ